MWAKYLLVFFFFFFVCLFFYHFLPIQYPFFISCFFSYWLMIGGRWRGSGFVQLACLFAPKVYIVLYKPEKNTRESIMAQHRSSSYALPTPPAIALNSLQQHQQQQHQQHQQHQPHQQLSSINGSRHSQQQPAQQQQQQQSGSHLGHDGPYVDEEENTNLNVSNEMRLDERDRASTSS